MLIDPALQALSVRGASDTYELTYRQPVIRQPNEEFALSLGFRHRAENLHHIFPVMGGAGDVVNCLVEGSVCVHISSETLDRASDSAG